VSLHRVWEVRCDGPAEWMPCPDSVLLHGQPDSPPIELLNSVANFHGWTRRDGVNRCEGCSRKASLS
jgi:hypothetical protein